MRRGLAPIRDEAMPQPLIHPPSAAQVHPAPGAPALPATMNEPAARPLPHLHGMAGLLASVAIHALLLVLFALWAYGSRGAPLPGDEVQIASLPTVELSDDRPELDATAEPRAAAEMEMEISPLSVADSGQFELADVASPLGFGGQGAISAGDLGQSGMASQASFMGLQARGERFCIIADCSGSMKGRKIEYLKSEVLRTIGSLTGSTRFQIYFFNNRAIPYPSPGWRSPRVELGGVRRWLEPIAARGGTNPKEAFQNAFNLRPLPDTIFFMTDGQFDPGVVDLVRSLGKAARRRVPIHTITFVDRRAADAMRAIATSSGGKYRHVAGF